MKDAAKDPEIPHQHKTTSSPPSLSCLGWGMTHFAMHGAALFFFLHDVLGSKLVEQGSGGELWWSLLLLPPYLVW